ncbi:MAG TPA: DNA replication complex GINS family protein [Candidatus Woesearchaeota archaeon]|nr:DNA replication complex GINS family protein [Candidatus Woesearchaeota archaeon]
MAEDEINITYESLFDILRNEKKTSIVQPLPKDFFSEVLAYIGEKYRSLANGKTEDLFISIDKEKHLRELNNLKAIIKEIIERRTKKIIDLAQISVKTQETSEELKNLLPEEQVLFKQARDVLDKYKRGVPDRLLNLNKPDFLNFNQSTGNKNQEQETEEKHELVRIIAPVPRFIGPDLKIYGPFSNEEIVKMPREITQVLIKKNRAEKIEIN